MTYSKQLHTEYLLLLPQDTFSFDSSGAELDVFDTHSVFGPLLDDFFVAMSHVAVREVLFNSKKLFQK